MARWCPNREETHLADDDGPLWGVATGGGRGSKGEGVTGARVRARLDECAFVIDGTIDTPLGTIRLWWRWWWQKRS